MDYRVEQLAAACEVSVDTVRFYQSRGLLPSPRREGRVALYGDEHAERIRKVRALQAQGLSLAVISRVLAGTLKRADADLAAAVAQAQADEDETLTIDQVAAASGVPTGLLRAVERAGLSLGRRVDGQERYTRADVALVREGMRLLEAGLPLDALLDLAARYDGLARDLAAHAISLFDAHVREPAADLGDEEAARRLVTAFGELLPAVTALVAHHFRRVLLQLAEEHLERGVAPAPPASRTPRASRKRAASR